MWRYHPVQLRTSYWSSPISLAVSKSSSICQRAPMAFTVSQSVVPGGGKDEVVGLLSRIGEAATNEQPVASILFPAMQQRDTRPVKESGAFGPLAHREALPILLMQQEGFHFPGFYPSASSLRSHEPNGFIT